MAWAGWPLSGNFLDQATVGVGEIGNKEDGSEKSTWASSSPLEQEREQNKLLRFHHVLSHGLSLSILPVTLERGNIIPLL